MEEGGPSAHSGKSRGSVSDPAPALAFRDRLDAEVQEIVVEHRGALLSERRPAIVLLLPHGNAVLPDARIGERG